MKNYGRLTDLPSGAQDHNEMRLHHAALYWGLTYGIPFMSSQRTDQAILQNIRK